MSEILYMCSFDTTLAQPLRKIVFLCSRSSNIKTKEQVQLQLQLQLQGQQRWPAERESTNNRLRR